MNGQHERNEQTMRILLAGGAGFIGSHTAVQMLNAGHDVIVVDNYSNSSPEAIRRVEAITGKKIKTDRKSVV